MSTAHIRPVPTLGIEGREECELERCRRSVAAWVEEKSEPFEQYACGHATQCMQEWCRSDALHRYCAQYRGQNARMSSVLAGERDARGTLVDAGRREHPADVSGDGAGGKRGTRHAAPTPRAWHSEESHDLQHGHTRSRFGNCREPVVKLDEVRAACAAGSNPGDGGGRSVEAGDAGA